jgi:hypothetical protein
MTPRESSYGIVLHVAAVFLEARQGQHRNRALAAARRARAVELRTAGFT